MIQKFLRAAFVLSSLVFVNELMAQAACQLQVTANGHVDLSRVFGSAYSSGGSTSATVTVTNNSGAPCHYVVALPNAKSARALLSNHTAYGAAGSETGNGIAYDVKSGAQILVGDVSGGSTTSVVASANEVLSGTLAPGASQGHQLTLSIPPRQLVPYVEGGYSDTIDVTVYDGTYGAATLSSDPQNKAAIKVFVDVKPDVRISLTPVGGATPAGLWAASAHDISADYTMDFGDMTKGNVQQQMQLNVVSNDGYQISFVSDNGGHLKNKATIPSLKTDASTVIDYTMSVNGTPIPLAGQSAFTADAITQPAGTLTSSSLLITVVVGDTSHALAGDYGDVVTITISNPS